MSVKSAINDISNQNTMSGWDKGSATNTALKKHCSGADSASDLTIYYQEFIVVISIKKSMSMRLINKFAQL